MYHEGGLCLVASYLECSWPLPTSPLSAGGGASCHEGPVWFPGDAAFPDKSRAPQERTCGVRRGRTRQGSVHSLQASVNVELPQILRMLCCHLFQLVLKPHLGLRLHNRAVPSRIKRTAGQGHRISHCSPAINRTMNRHALHTHTHPRTHTHTQTDRHTHTHTHTETDTDTRTQPHTHTHRDTATHTHTETQRHRHTDTHTHTYTHTHTDTHTHAHTHTHKHTHTHTHTHPPTHTPTHR